MHSLTLVRFDFQHLNSFGLIFLSFLIKHSIFWKFNFFSEISMYFKIVKKSSLFRLRKILWKSSPLDYHSDPVISSHPWRDTFTSRTFGFFGASGAHATDEPYGPTVSHADASARVLSTPHTSRKTAKRYNFGNNFAKKPKQFAFDESFSLSISTKTLFFSLQKNWVDWPTLSCSPPFRQTPRRPSCQALAPTPRDESPANAIHALDAAKQHSGCYGWW